MGQLLHSKHALAPQRPHPNKLDCGLRGPQHALHQGERVVPAPGACAHTCTPCARSRTPPHRMATTMSIGSHLQHRRDACVRAARGAVVGPAAATHSRSNGSPASYRIIRRHTHSLRVCTTSATASDSATEVRIQYLRRAHAPARGRPAGVGSAALRGGHARRHVEHITRRQRRHKPGAHGAAGVGWQPAAQSSPTRTRACAHTRWRLRDRAHLARQ